MATDEQINNFKCPDCGKNECDLEQDWMDDGELLAEDLVCDHCGGFIRLV